MQVQQQNRGSLSFTLVFIVTKVTSFWLINLKNLIQNQHRFSDVEHRLRNLLWTPWMIDVIGGSLRLFGDYRNVDLCSKSWQETTDILSKI